MLARLLCLLLLTVLGPSATALADCCEADRSCCAGEAPACPVQPGGECSIASAHPIAPVVEPRVDATPAMEGIVRVVPSPADSPARDGSGALLHATSSGFLRFIPLRN